MSEKTQLFEMEEPRFATVFVYVPTLPALFSAHKQELTHSVLTAHAQLNACDS